ITRVFGTGNGGNILEITDEEESEILTNWKDNNAELHYEANRAPFLVKVYDPKIVKGGSFNVKLSSRLTYKKVPAIGTLSIGDTIRSTGDFNVSLTANTQNPNTVAEPKNIPGIAIVRNILPSVFVADTATKTTVEYAVLDIEMLNDHLNGSFVVNIDKKLRAGNPPNQTTEPNGSGIETRPFVSVNSNFQATAEQFILNDHWTLTKPDGSKVAGTRPISEFNEQIIPEYGIALEFKHAFNPGYQIDDFALNGFQEATMTFANSNAKWLEGVQNGDPRENKIQWLLKELNNEPIPKPSTYVNNLDPNANYWHVLNGTWGPYAITTTASSYGPAYEAIKDEDRVLYNLQNVDIVITSDTSKWTRVPVLQGEFGSEPSSRKRSFYTMTNIHSNVPSVDKMGNPDNTKSAYHKDSLSRSMGWFPGYAIDLDRGIRLNMMFSEFGKKTTTSKDASDPGRNLKWDPTSSTANGENYGRNYIYVMRTKYDEGRELSRKLDSTKYELANSYIAYSNYIRKHIFNNVTWVGYPRLANGAKSLATDVRIRMRVSRYFTSYNPTGEYNLAKNSQNQEVIRYKGNFNPEYTFNTSPLVPQVNQSNIATSALDLIRVVPNPYYGFSQYEQRQLDNIVKFTNLPRKCKISIFTVNGTLVKTFNKDSSPTFLDWNLKNDNNLPIASGVYIIHIDAGNIGNKVVKWFGIMRPMDLESF
ncbi:MAG TPA: T9SS type A sorting domain-containing protein, partial [Flavisolibacter sp.]|nr:T9SS type A sorting domain-containing protein [Flavisolibacter sp.]